MKNYVQPGNTITIPAPVAVMGGDVLIVGELKGVVAGDAELGMSCDVSVTGVFRLPKVASAFAVGDVAFFDPATKLIVADNTKPRLGVVVADASADAATADVRLG
jgi:predicted RecA/RadA family phage recombinase